MNDRRAEIDPGKQIRLFNRWKIPAGYTLRSIILEKNNLSYFLLSHSSKPAGQAHHASIYPSRHAFVADTKRLIREKRSKRAIEIRTSSFMVYGAAACWEPSSCSNRFLPQYKFVRVIEGRFARVYASWILGEYIQD